MKSRLAKRACALVAMKVAVLALAAPASATVIPISDFQTIFGAASFDHFNQSPTSSAQSLGQTGASIITANNGNLEGRFHNQITITDNPAVNGATFPTPPANPTAWSLRDFIPSSLQAGTNTGNTPPDLPSARVGNTGFVGFYLRTTAQGLTTSIGIDDESASITERGSFQSVIADGQWHLYEWNLGDAAQWEAQFGASNGAINNTAAMIDAIWLWRDAAFNDGSAAVIDLDFVAYNPAGSLNPIAGIFNTGLDENGLPATPYTGDAHWVVNRVGSATAPASTGVGVAAAVVNEDGNPVGPGAWASNTATSGWIASQYTINFDDIAGFYDFSIEFDVAAGDATGLLIEGQWMADDNGVDIYLNGISTGQTASSNSVFTPFSLSGFLAGINRLTFRTQNIGTTDSGIRVEFLRVAVINPIVPEPATAGLAAMGALALASRRRRQAKA